MRSLTLAVLAVEQVGGDDLEVVVRGVRERAAAVAVAQRPDAGHVGREPVVDHDVAARVGRDAGAVEPEVVGVRPAADGEQHVRADDLGRPVVAVDARPRRRARARAKRMHSAPVRTAMPSPSRMSRIASEMSSSSRAISRGAFSTTVTSAPKRRYICANSSPM